MESNKSCESLKWAIYSYFGVVRAHAGAENGARSSLNICEFTMCQPTSFRSITSQDFCSLTSCPCEWDSVGPSEEVVSTHNYFSSPLQFSAPIGFDPALAVLLVESLTRTRWLAGFYLQPFLPAKCDINK